MRKYEVGSPVGESTCHLIATLEFDDLAALEAGLATAEGQAAATDVAVFADGGVEMLVFEGRGV